MHRPLYTWIALALCLALALFAVGWMSWSVMRLDRSERRARQDAQLGERVRLALWRMESWLAPRIAREGARPYFVYSPFYPAERAYTRMFAEIEQGEVLVPSPLLTQRPPEVVIHFQYGPDGALSSPQVPTGNMRDLAEARYTTHVKIEAAARSLDQVRRRVPHGELARRLAAAVRSEGEQPQQVEGVEPRVPSSSFAQQQRFSAKEWRARVTNVQRAQQLANGRGDKALHLPVQEGAAAALWFGDVLVLARPVKVVGETYIQGCWLDWPGMKRSMLDTVRDLLPEADVLPAPARGAEYERRTLATAPVRLAPGPMAVEPVAGPSPVWLSLGVAWVCVAAAAGALTALVLGALSLSERRGAFVSAVTHELRTPLTTLRMYSEMLADGVVADDDKRQQYLTTLTREADRLGHLVDNVLAYAQLERTDNGARLEELSVEALLERSTDRLAERAERDSMTLQVQGPAHALQTSVRADPAAVEQILLNLVDNACKYGSAGPGKLIRIDAAARGSGVDLRLSDDGPGIAKTDAKRLFKPFSKSARDAAHSAPGVGLGLALCRRLARQMGGDLRLDADAGPGACFVLTLPQA